MTPVTPPMQIAWSASCPPPADLSAMVLGRPVLTRADVPNGWERA